MEFKGTKGKWELKNKGREVVLNIKPCTCKSICSSNYNTKWQFDMLLISKAPEMLEMLNRCHSWIINCNGDIQITKDIEKLIKEATEI